MQKYGFWDYHRKNLQRTMYGKPNVGSNKVKMHIRVVTELSEQKHLYPNLIMSSGSLVSWLHFIKYIYIYIYIYTGRFIMSSVIKNIYNKKTKGPTSMELFTATGKIISFFF